MKTRYVEVGAGIEAKVANGYLYVKYSNMRHGCLEQGGRCGRILRVKYDGTLADAIADSYWGISDIDRTINDQMSEHSVVEVVRHGILIM